MSRDDKARMELYPLISEAIEKGYADLGCGLDISVAQAITANMYTALMREGYRKESSVVREIFEEIDRMIYKVLNDKHYIMGDMCYEVAELKKKYTEEARQGNENNS